MSELCKHGIRNLATNVPYCRRCDDELKGSAATCKEPDDANANLYAENAELRRQNEALRSALTFDGFRSANVKRCLKWHPNGIESWSPSDWLTAVTGELGELASLLKMRNRERDGLVGNKFSPTDKQIEHEVADVLTYLDLLAYVLGVDMGRAAAEKFNEVSERNGFTDRIELPCPKT